MPTFQTLEQTESIRVAVVIERGKIKPVWFEQTDKASGVRVTVKEVCYTWQHMSGASKILSFAVSDGANSYRLSLDTVALTWALGVTKMT